MRSLKKIGPFCSPDDPMLEIEVLGDRNNFIDLQRTRLEIVASIVQTTGNGIQCRTNTGNILRMQDKDTHHTWSVIVFHLFFRKYNVLEWRKLSKTNGSFAQKSFIETDFLHGKDAKQTWLTCQSYYYEDDPSGIAGANKRVEDVAGRKRIVSVSTEVRLFSKIACDFLSCDEHLISGVTIRPSLRRSFNDWRQEDDFAKEPVRQMIVAMSTNTAYLGRNRKNQFPYQKFGLNEIIVYQNSLPIAGCPLPTTDNKQIDYNTLEALDFVINNSQGISLANYHNH